MAIKLEESKISGCPYQLKATELVKEMDFLQKYQEKGIKKESHEENSINRSHRLRRFTLVDRVSKQRL